MGKKIALIVIISVLAAIVIAIAAYLIVVRVSSKPWRITLTGENVPNPIPEESEESFIELSTGIRMCYVKYGSGKEPLVLVHGNGGSHKSLENLARLLANDYTVYAIDSRNQGKSTVAEEVSYSLMADDVAAFINGIGLVKPLLVGHSDGGIIAIQTAISYPTLLKAFMSCGANASPQGLKLYFTLPIRIRYAFTHKLLDRIMIEEPCFSPDDLAKIEVPSYIIAGEFDIMPLKESKYIAENIEGSKLAIVSWGMHSYIRDAERGYELIARYFSELE